MNLGGDERYVQDRRVEKKGIGMDMTKTSFIHTWHFQRIKKIIMNTYFFPKNNINS